MPLDTTTEVDTPEHVRFRYFLAGPTRRTAAYLLDLAVRLGIVLFFLVIQYVFLGGGPKSDEKAGTGFLLVVLFAVEWGYYVLLEMIWGGRSIGKRAFGLRVVKAGGYPITFIDSALRNLLRAADFLPFAYILGFLVCGLDKRFRRLGDLVADTIVVVEASGRVVGALKVKAAPEELSGLPSRVVLSAEELELIELFLRRIGTLSVAREAELAQLIAPPIATRLGVRFDDGSRFLRCVYVRATA